MKSPCMGCETRTPPDCHITCEKYKTFRAEKDKELEAKEKDRKATPALAKEVLKQLYKDMKWR